MAQALSKRKYLHLRDLRYNLTEAHSPLKASNNIQGLGGRWEDFQSLRDPELTRRQEQLVRKVITELKDSDNVIYEISNGPFNNQVDPTAVNEWHRHMAAFIIGQEKLLGVKHLVAANEAIHDDRNVSVLNWHYVANSWPTLSGWMRSTASANRSRWTRPTAR